MKIMTELQADRRPCLPLYCDTHYCWGIAMIKSMTNGEYLRLYAKSMASRQFILDESPKRRKRPKPQLNKTFGHGFVLIMPSNLTTSEEAFIKRKKKKPKRTAAKKR